MDYKTNSTEETIDLAFQLSRFLLPGDVLLLDGDLGAGKTHFVKGLARGLGVATEVTSPTFAILNCYPAQPGPEHPPIDRLNHFDVYRVHDETELLDLGFEETLYGDDITVIEWSSLIPGILPEDHLRITIRIGGSPDERLIRMNWTKPERRLPDADTRC